MAATLIFRPNVAPRARNRTYLLPLLLGWTGMRGVVSLAAALAIPVALDNGSPFPNRNLILFITFIVILLTLLLQGLTLPILIKRSGIFEDILKEEREKATRQNMKKGLKQHVYQFMKNKHENELKGHDGMDKLMHMWEERAKATDDSWMNENTKAIFIELLESQRNYLSDLNKDPEIDEEIIRTQLYQIDLEEERLKIIMIR
jgi:CPA1 family monovalent cation:H+ antiporter